MRDFSVTQKITQFAKDRELVSIAELRSAGFADMEVSRLTASGMLERIGRGIYRCPDAPLTEHFDLKVIFYRKTNAVLALLSALRFHEIGTQAPREVWLQIPAKDRVPAISWPQIRVIRSRTAAAFTEGVVLHELEGIQVPVTTPARTVADCFKHRTQVGIDTCVEALREVLRSDRNVMPELTRHAQMNRVFQLMQPYMEALV